MQRQRLAELPADREHRIERARRVLEDHGDAPAAHPVQRRARGAPTRFACRRAARCRRHARLSPASRPSAASHVTDLPRAGFADEAERLARAARRGRCRAGTASRRSKATAAGPAMRDQRRSLHRHGLENCRRGNPSRRPARLPLDRLRLGGEGRVLVQHRVGGIFALADLQHARGTPSCAPPGRSRSPGTRDSLFISAFVHSPICCCWPFGPCWATIERDRIVERRRVRPVAHRALSPSRSMICVQFSLHLDLDVEADRASTSRPAICAVATWLV